MRINNQNKGGIWSAFVFLSNNALNKEQKKCAELLFHVLLLLLKKLRALWQECLVYGGITSLRC